MDNFNKFLSFLCVLAMCWPNCSFADFDPFGTEKKVTVQSNQTWNDTSGIQISSTSAVLPPNFTSKTLTLSELTDFALLHNPNTRSAWAQAKVAAANLGRAESAYLPTLVTELSATKSYNNNNQANNANRNNTTKSYEANLTLNYLLLDFGHRFHTTEAARYQLLTANFNQNAAIQQLVLQVEQLYYQIIGQQALVDADQLSVKEAKANLRAAKARHQQGMATIGDVYQTQAALAQAELDLQTATGTLATQQGQLATTLLLPVQTTFTLAPLNATIPSTAVTQTIDELLHIANSKRPDLLAAEAHLRAQQANFSAVKAQALPSLQFSAGAGKTRTIGVNTSTQHSLELTVTLPLFTGFSQTYAEHQAQANVMQAAADRDQLLQKVNYEVWQAYYGLQTATAAVKSTEILLKSSIQAARQANGQYRAGVGDILQVISTQATAANARMQHIQARLNWYITLSQLATALGTIHDTGSP